jgi:hypothetical protein
VAVNGNGTTPPRSAEALAERGEPSAAANALVDSAHRGGPLADASIPELVGRVINDVSDLADRQIELVKLEVSETVDQAKSTITILVVGAALVLVAVVLAVIWFWTAFIWFFNWLGAFIGLPWLGWPIGILVPAGLAFFAYKRFIERSINDVRSLQPLSRTRATLKEDLEWVQTLRTRGAR